jgi:hypothetical protein
MKAFVTKIRYNSNDYAVEVVYRNSNLTLNTYIDINVVLADVNTPQDLKALTEIGIADFATSQSMPTITEIVWLTQPAIVPAGLKNAPQAAIANAPADATTNYNTVTTLLGALTGAVNTANAKQNDIATKLNTLLAELRTLGLISS